MQTNTANVTHCNISSQCLVSFATCFTMLYVTFQIKAILIVIQFVGTAILLCIVGALTDERNNSPSKNIFPLMIGHLIMSIGLSYGYNCGFPINPARDLGPRIFTAVAGWGLEPFRYSVINSTPHEIQQIRTFYN